MYYRYRSFNAHRYRNLIFHFTSLKETNVICQFSGVLATLWLRDNETICLALTAFGTDMRINELS